RPGRHVPATRRADPAQRGEHPPRLHGVQPLPADDGCRRDRAVRGDRSLHRVGDDAMSMPDGFVFLDEEVPGIRWDAKYATWDNFTGRPVDGYEVNRIVGSQALAAALHEAASRAAAIGFGLLLWDAYRPQRAVDHFLTWSTQPE